MELLEILQKRRSVRKYTAENISQDKLEKILQAGLLAPSSRAIYPVELVAVRDKEMLRKLSECKAAGAAMLKNADAAIVVVGDTAKSDAWIEDCSITMTLKKVCHSLKPGCGIYLFRHIIMCEKNRMLHDLTRV